MNEDHFIYMKVGNPDPKTNQPRFDVIYILEPVGVTSRIPTLGNRSSNRSSATRTSEANGW